MTDSTLPVPQPEPAASRRKLNRKWIVAGVVLALGLGGAAYGVHAKGDAKADEYSSALRAWNDQKNHLLDAPSVANRDLWDFDDATTKKSLAKQKVACERVLTLRKSAAGAAGALPKAPDSFFKLLSSAEREAIQDSLTREKAVKAYATAADKVLVQMHNDCVWNIRVNSVEEGDSGSKKIFDKAEALLLKPGRSDGLYYCPSSSKGSCIPASGAKRTRYAELILKAIKTDKAYVMKHFFAAGSCDSTSYDELCSVLKSSLASYYGNLSDYGAIFKSFDLSNGKLKQEFEQMTKGNKAADKAFRKALFKSRPGFKEDFRVSESAFWREAYFNASAVESIASLEKFGRAVLQRPQTVTV